MQDCAPLFLIRKTFVTLSTADVIRVYDLKADGSTIVLDGFRSFEEGCLQLAPFHSPTLISKTKGTAIAVPFVLRCVDKKDATFFIEKFELVFDFNHSDC